MTQIQADPGIENVALEQPMELGFSDERSLIAKLSQGDAAAAASLFDLHVAAVFNHARRICGNHADADDLVSGTFLEMWRKRHEIRGFQGSLRPWLLLTATYLNANKYRSAKRLSAFLDRGIFEAYVPDHAEAIVERDEQQEQIAAITAEFQLLSATDQAVVTLCLVEHMTYADAAACLGLSHAQVRNRLSRARARLKTAANRRES